MTVLNQLQAGYSHISDAERRLQQLAEAFSHLVAEAETKLAQARQDLDAIGQALGYAMPEPREIPLQPLPPPDSVPYPELAALSHDQ